MPRVLPLGPTQDGRARVYLRACAVPVDRARTPQLGDMSHIVTFHLSYTCSCLPPPPLPTTAVRDLFQLERIKKVADIVWQAMKEWPANYSLTPEACAAFEQSVQTSQIFIEFRESTPGTVFEYLPGTPNAPPQKDESHDSPPNSYTCDQRPGQDSGIFCKIFFRHDDCLLLVKSNLVHELAHAFRRLVFWRSHIDGNPSVEPWASGSPGARATLKETLQEGELWGLMLLDDVELATRRGIRSGFVVEHSLHGGVVVGLPEELRNLTVASDGSAALPQPMTYALISKRVAGNGGELATFTGRQVLPTDTDFDAVRARPLLTWQAPMHALRNRTSCCGGDPPGVRSCPRSLKQMDEMYWQLGPQDASPTPPARVPASR